MDFVCDVNISHKIVRWLRGEGFEATHVVDLLQTDEASDPAIAREADRLGATVITKDKRFVSIVRGRLRPRRSLILDDQNSRVPQVIQLITLHLDRLRRSVRGEADFSYFIDRTGALLDKLP